MFKSFIARLMRFVLRRQTAALTHRINLFYHRAVKMSHAPIVADLKELNAAHSDWLARVSKFKSEWDATEGIVPPESLELFHYMATTLQEDHAKYIERRAELVSAAEVIIECEVQPLLEEAELIKSMRAGLLQRLAYLSLWMKGEITAPVLELLLYFLVPISHLEHVAGDLEEEYRTIQLPRRGPRAAQWWYTKHVLKTVAQYSAWALKRASVVVTAVGLLRRIALWLGL